MNEYIGGQSEYGRDIEERLLLTLIVLKKWVVSMHVLTRSITQYFFTRENVGVSLIQIVLSEFNNTVIILLNTQREVTLGKVILQQLDLVTVCGLNTC